jgi:hypothetical protein
MNSPADEAISYIIETGPDVSFNVIAREIYQLWDEVHEAGTALNLDAVSKQCNFAGPESTGERGILVSKSAAGLDHSVIELVVTFMGGKFATTLGEGAKAASRDLWKKVILPYLQNKYGTNVLKEQPKGKQAHKAESDGQ